MDNDCGSVAVRGKQTGVRLSFPDPREAIPIPCKALARGDQLKIPPTGFCAVVVTAAGWSSAHAAEGFRRLAVVLLLSLVECEGRISGLRHRMVCEVLSVDHRMKNFC